MDLSPTLGPNFSTGVERTTSWGSGRMRSVSCALFAGYAVRLQFPNSSRKNFSQEYIAKLRIPVSASRPQSRTVFAKGLDSALPSTETRRATTQLQEMYG
jgi:hypothetical protein